jgi:hypothetical protein
MQERRSPAAERETSLPPSGFRKQKPAAEERFVRVRHRVVSTAPVAQFACPTCNVELQAVLQEEDTTVRCECGCTFIARLPPAKPTPRPKENMPPVDERVSSLHEHKLHEPPSIPSRAESDTSSIQSIPHASSASSLVAVSTAPSVISVVSGEDPTQELTPPPEHEAAPSEAAATPLTTFVRLLGLG